MPMTRLAENAVRLTVRVTPRGGRDAVDGLGADEAGRPFLRLRVSAAPSDGAANAAAVKLLAKLLGAPKSAVTVIAGRSARVKQIRIEGEPADLERRPAELLGRP